MIKLIKKFSKDEAGAVTVDWVVLTAAVVGLCLVLMAAVGGAINDAGNAIAGDIRNTAGVP